MPHTLHSIVTVLFITSLLAGCASPGLLSPSRPDGTLYASHAELVAATSGVVLADTADEPSPPGDPPPVTAGVTPQPSAVKALTAILALPILLPFAMLASPYPWYPPYRASLRCKWYGNNTKLRCY